MYLLGGGGGVRVLTVIKGLWEALLFKIFTVVSAFLTLDHPYSVAVPMGCRYLNATHRSKKKDAVLKRPIAS